MKKVLVSILLFTVGLFLAGCDLIEQIDNKNVVDLGNGEKSIRWNLVLNDNKYRPVESAYFEFNNEMFKYYEDGILKKEGTHRITFFDINENNAPLHLNLQFGTDDTGLSIYDYIDCYTEDSKENLHQFTIISEGYHIRPLRGGGVPIRNYYLSNMPYALGTYIKEGTEYYSYKNGKVDYLGCSKLNGTFIDEKGNTLYFVNNSYSSKYESAEYSKYTIYMRYENNENNTYIEGTIKLSYHEETSEVCDSALIHVMHGESEPAEESGTYAFPDYELIGFKFISDDIIEFTSGDYFYDNRECSFDPTNFVGGKYIKVNINENNMGI